MATESWTSGPGVGRSLAQSPQEFRFFQAVRLLRLFSRGQSGAAESLRFRTHLPLDFPASEIFDLVVGEGAAQNNGKETDGGHISAAPPVSMSVTFMGLTGISGVLPYHYTDLLLKRKQTLERQGIHDDPAHAFFDLFSHRLIELFYAAWEKYRFFLHHESGKANHLPQHLLDLVGIGVRSLHGRLNKGGHGVPDGMLAYYAGVLSNQKRSAQTLAAVIGDYFGVKARVAQLCGRWLRIPEADQSKLGSDCSTLGDDLVLGDMTWDTQSLCRVQLGPMSWSQYQSFLPQGDAHPPLSRFARWYLGWGMDAQLQIILSGSRSVDEPRTLRGPKREGWTDVPPPRLGHPQLGVRLGWAGWLGGRIEGEAAEDCVLSIEREEI